MRTMRRLDQAVSGWRGRIAVGSAQPFTGRRRQRLSRRGRLRPGRVPVWSAQRPLSV